MKYKSLFRKIVSAGLLLMIGHTGFSQFVIGTIPKGDSIVIRHDVTINPGGSIPAGTDHIANQWTIKGSNFSNFVTDDPDTVTPLDSTSTVLVLCINSTLPVIKVLKSTVCSGAPDTLVITGGSLNDGTHWQWYTGSCGGTPATVQNALGDTLFVTPSVNTTYYVRGEGGCVTGTPCANATVTINNTSNWLGSASSNWFDPANWSCGLIPAAITDVIIPPNGGTVLFQPVIGPGTANTHNLTINTSATITINSGATLNINGGGVVTNHGTFRNNGTFNQ
jgi:hypothetical protein